MFFGCRFVGLLNVSNTVLPDDLDFLRVISSLNAPKKIVNYMEENFYCSTQNFYNVTPYELFLGKAGDCSDFSTFASFVANYHGYETYQIVLYIKDMNLAHALAVFLEDGSFNYSSNFYYYRIRAGNFRNIVEHYVSAHNMGYYYYRVYNYKLILVEDGYI
jgi:hypothetical protein